MLRAVRSAGSRFGTHPFPQVNPSSSVGRSAVPSRAARRSLSLSFFFAQPRHLASVPNARIVMSDGHSVVAVSQRFSVELFTMHATHWRYG